MGPADQVVNQLDQASVGPFGVHAHQFGEQLKLPGKPLKLLVLPPERLIGLRFVFGVPLLSS
jgi:hypothetical protein